MGKIKISAVAYTNTKPFVYGLLNSSVIEQIDLSLDIPSLCADKLIGEEVAIGLIPVAAIPMVPHAQIISSYCIGSIGAVNSVFIFSHKPLDEVETLQLDPQSRTSNNLAKILLKHYFKKQVRFLTEPTAVVDAIVLIGDRTFSQRHQFAYQYDLGQLWMEFSGLPFMYAAWVANRPLSANFLNDFDAALAYGLQNIDQVVAELPPVDGVDLTYYLSKQLDFKLTDDKLKAKDLFLSLIDS